MRKGTIKFFNEKKGFGFIVDEATGQDIFVHITNITGKIMERDVVTFEISQGKKGEYATQVKKAA